MIPKRMIRVVWGRIGIGVLTAAAVLTGASAASASQLRLGRCALKPHARLVLRTAEVIVSSVDHTQEVAAQSVTNPTYSTCLRRTGERRRLFAASSEPSPDTGYQSYVAAFRAAGHYLLYVPAFTHDNPEGSTTTATFHVVDVAHHDRQTLTVPDPSIQDIGVDQVALSVDGFLAWTQVNVNAQTVATTGTAEETVEADTGSGPITLASAPVPDTLTPLAFHKLAFHGETVTWLYGGQLQSAQLKP